MNHNHDKYDRRRDYDEYFYEIGEYMDIED